MEQEQKFKRSYLITGSAHRIGRSLALNLAKDAEVIIIHYNNSKKDAEELAKEIEQMGTKAFTIAANLSSPSQAGDLISRAWETAGPVDVLINNASIFEAGKLQNVTVNDLQRNMMVNAFAPLLLSREFAGFNAQRETTLRPVIINMLDTHVSSYDREHTAYDIAKKALLWFTKITALEFAPGVRVNGIAPGLILPPARKDMSYLEQLKSTNPLNDIGTLDQIGQAARFLIENEFVTGQVIYIDGGRHLKGHLQG
jgi:pteridine reductase